MRNIIIGLAGKKDSGKDTAASMINYILRTGVTRAKFQDWTPLQEPPVLHFADTLKEIVSMLYGIPLERMYERYFKDCVYFNLRTRNFVCNDIVKATKDKLVLDNGNLREKSMAEHLADNPATRQVYIRLRTLLQYFGTDICRHNLQDDIWIRCTMNKAVETAERYGVCTIADVRFKNECDAVRCHGDSLYGGVLLIRRGGYGRNGDGGDDGHESETIDFDTDYVIDNDKTLMSLFYKILQICQEIV